MDFLHAKLLNANFEGVDLGSKKANLTLENTAYLLRGHTSSPDKISQIVMELIDVAGPSNLIRLSEVHIRGNDIFVDYDLINYFSRANLENANFKNANIQYGVFSSANLTNANFAGADLTKSNLRDANLEGANLTGAILDGAILSCKNHPICVPET